MATIVKVTYMEPNGVERDVYTTDDHFTFPLSTLSNYDLITAVMNKFKETYPPNCEILAIEIIAR